MSKSKKGHDRWYEILPRDPKPGKASEWPVKSLNRGDKAYTLTQCRKDTKAGRCVVPSVTTIVKEAYNYGIQLWEKEQVALAALEHPPEGFLDRLKEGVLDFFGLESKEHWLARVQSEAFQQVRDAADYGTAVHKEPNTPNLSLIHI